MRVLLVKTSSLGDLIHTFPAITDATRALPGVKFDWVTEPAYEELCSWHSAVEEVITVSYRHWRRHPIKGIFGGHLRHFQQKLRAKPYDAIIDAQGLYKSAVITSMTDGVRHGYDRLSCREKLAPFAYDNKIRVSRSLHAIRRNRNLFASALHYPSPENRPDYGLDRNSLAASPIEAPYILLLHGSARRTKLWPVDCWRQLASIAGKKGYRVAVPWANDIDRRRASEIGDHQTNVVKLETSLTGMGSLVAAATGVVGVETGFTHLAAAFNRPTVSLYGSTGAAKEGTCGIAQAHISSKMPCSPCHNKICNYTANVRHLPPCLSEISPAQVWDQLQDMLDQSN